MDISDSKLKQCRGQPWSSLNISQAPNFEEIKRMRNKVRPRDYANLLPLSLMHLYGSRPALEVFSVGNCPACKNVMKTQWMSSHFKRDIQNNMVCRRTELIVSGGAVVGKSTLPLFELNGIENPLTDFLDMKEREAAIAKLSNTKSASSTVSSSSNSSSSSKSKSSSSSKDKIESVPSTSSSSSGKIKSGHIQSSKIKPINSSSFSHSSSSSSSNKNKSSSSSCKDKTSSSSWSKSSSKSYSKSSSSSTTTPGSYTLSIPSTDTGQNESVESLLFSNVTTGGTKHMMQIIATSTGLDKSKTDNTEYEQLKFYADSTDKKSKTGLEPNSDSGHTVINSSVNVHSDNSHFKIPLKNKSFSSSISGSSSTSESSNKKSKSSSKSTHDSSTSSKSFHRASSSSLGSPKSTPSATLPVVVIESKDFKSTDKGSKEGSNYSSHDTKEKSSSGHKKKKKKKDKDEPRKVIPLKDRAFHPDQHCGVCHPEESHPCTRSLTCKTHSIAFRRAVSGRSLPFDTLLAAHKKARDEEKTANKSREQVEELKGKSKKHSQSSSTSGISTTSETNSSSIASPSSFSRGIFSATTISSGNGQSSVPSSTTQSNSSKQTSHSPASKVSNVSLATHRQQPHTKLQSGTGSKSTSKVIIAEEREEPPGMSLFDLPKDPENNFVYVAAIHPPKCSTVTRSESKSRNINALTESNSLLDLCESSNKRERPHKKKGFKDPLVELALVPKHNSHPAQGPIRTSMDETTDFFKSEEASGLKQGTKEYWTDSTDYEPPHKRTTRRMGDAQFERELRRDFNLNLVEGFLSSYNFGETERITTEAHQATQLSTVKIVRSAMYGADVPMFEDYFDTHDGPQ